MRTFVIRCAYSLFVTALCFLLLRLSDPIIRSDPKKLIWEYGLNYGQWEDLGKTFFIGILFLFFLYKRNYFVTYINNLKKLSRICNFVAVKPEKEGNVINSQNPISEPSNIKQTTTMSQIPESFVADLEKQVKEQYKIIIRFRDLRNDTQDEDLRAKYAKEIALRQENIKEIQTEFLNQIRIENPNITEIEVTKISNAVVEAVRKELEVFKSDLQTFIKADLKTAISQLNFTFSTETQAKLQEQFDFLQTENKEGALALANLILDMADNQENVNKELAKIISLVKEIKGEDALALKLKLALPIAQEYFPDAKIEAEIELKPVLALKQVWDKLKFWQKEKK